MRVINPLIDVAFKMVFEEKNLLKSFLNSFLDFQINDLTVSSQVKLSKETIDSKESFLDLKVVTDDGKVINIEIQLAKDNDFIKRSIFYSSKLVTQDLRISEDYGLVPKVISVNLLDFKRNAHQEQYFSHYKLFDPSLNHTLDEGIEYYFIEFPKINGSALDIQNSPFDRWLLFLKPDINHQLYEEVLRMDKNIEKAEDKLYHIQEDPVLKEKYDARFKNLTDEANRLHSAEENGIEKGHVQARKQTVARLIQLGKTYEEIETLLGYNPKKYI